MTDQEEKPSQGAASRLREIQIRQGGGLQFNDMSQLWEFCQLAFASGLLPTGIDSPPKAALIAVAGQDLGLSPFQAWQNMGIINGKPTVYGDLSLVRLDAWDQIVSREEWYELDGKRIERRPHKVVPGMDLAAVCEITYQLRDGTPAVKTSVFHLAEAEAAKLFPPQKRSGGADTFSPWFRFPARQLMWKARNWGARDVYPDVLKGFMDRNEMLDAFAPQEEEREVDVEVEDEDRGGDDWTSEESRDERYEKSEEDFEAFSEEESKAEELQQRADDPSDGDPEKGDTEAEDDARGEGPFEVEGDPGGPEPPRPARDEQDVLARLVDLNDMPRTELSQIWGDMDIEEDLRRRFVKHLFPTTPPSNLTKANLARLIHFVETEGVEGLA